MKAQQSDLISARLKSPAVPYALFWLVLAYTVSHVMLLFNRGIYFDDAFLTTMTPEELLCCFDLGGYKFWGYLHGYLLALKNGVLIYRATTFLSYLVAAVCLNSILQTIDELDPWDRFTISLFFAALPLNIARIALIVTPYAVAYALFFIGFWMISRYTTSPHLAWRIASLPMFFASFTMNSLLFFFALVIAFIGYKERWSFRTLEPTVRRLLSYSDLLMVPIIYWICKILWWKPHGVRSSYNEIHPVASRMFEGGVAAFNLGTIVTLERSLSLVSIVCLVMTIFVALARRPKSDNVIEKMRMLFMGKLFAVGIVCFGLAIFPYLAVNHYAFYSDWLARDLILMPLASSLIIYSIFSIIIEALRLGRGGRIAIAVILALSFVSMNVQAYFEYQKEYYKQVSLSLHFNDIKSSNKDKTFIVSDYANGLNAFMRPYTFLEHQGMMNYVFGERYALLIGIRRDAYTDFSAIIGDEFYDEMRKKGIPTRKDFYAANIPHRRIIVEQDEFDRTFFEPSWGQDINTITHKRIAQLLFHQLFAPQKFRQEVAALLKTSVMDLKFMGQAHEN